MVVDARAGKDLPGIAHEEEQQVPFLGRQVKPLPGTACLVLDEIDLKVGNLYRLQLTAWTAAQQVRYRGVTKYLPPYRHVYYPQPIRRAG